MSRRVRVPRHIDPVTGFWTGDTERDLSAREVLLSLAIFIAPNSSALVRRAAAPKKEIHMSQHRIAKRPFSRTTDGERHPVTTRRVGPNPFVPAKPVVNHVGTPAYYNDTLDPISPNFDPNSWGEENRTVISAAINRTPNPEPQHVVVAGFDADAPAMPREMSTTRRPGIPVPRMDHINAKVNVPEGHVDVMADTHSWDR